MVKMFSLILTFLTIPYLMAQQADNVKIIQRFDIRKKIDNKYLGLFYGYLEGIWNIESVQEGKNKIKARYYLIQESRHNNVLVEKPLQEELQSSFILTDTGQMTEFQGDGVPYYRNYPQRPSTELQEGSTWVGKGEIVQDIQGNGQFTRIPILIEYRWKGETLYAEQPVWEVASKYAIRYVKGQDPQGDLDIEKGEGTRDGWIYFDKKTLKPLYIREKIKEIYQIRGEKWLNEGIILTFFENFPSLDKTQEAAKIASDLAQENILDVQVQEDDRGVKLTLQNLRFVADQAVLLPGESERLDKIVAVLRTTGSLLVVGHTANVGSQESQITLSRERALTIVQQLKQRGIDAKRLIYDGRGGREPVASNADEEGRSLNRRVELILLNN